MTVIAFTLTEAPLLLVKCLAVIAGVFCGAFVLSLVVRLLYRLIRAKPMPSWGAFVVRIAGAAAGGIGTWLLVAELQFGLGGGDGPGGGGKDGGKTEATRTDKAIKPDDKVEPPKDADKSKSEEKPLHVFVLGLKDLRDRLKVQSPNIDNCYWIQGEPRTQLLDLEGLKKELRIRREKDSKLKVFMDSTDYSPDRLNPYFWVPLERWLRDEMLYSAKE
jgi:hypothetical protein